MTTRGLEISKLFKELETVKKNSEAVIDVSTKTVDIARVLAERGLLDPARECRHLSDELQVDVLDYDLWRKLYSCLARVGIKAALGVECPHVDIIDIRVLERGVSRESMELFKMLEEEARAKICALAKDYDTLKRVDEILSYSRQKLSEVYSISGDCLSRYEEKAIGLLRRYDLRPLYDELRKVFDQGVLESLLKLGVKEGNLRELAGRISSLETRVRRPILRYLLLQLKKVEELKGKLVDKCACAEDPAAFLGEVKEFLGGLRDRITKLIRLIEKVEELRPLANKLGEFTSASSLSDVIKAVEVVFKDASKDGEGVDEIEELIGVLLNTVGPDGKSDLTRVYEEIKRLNNLSLINTMLKLCGEGVLKCVVYLY